MSGDAVAGPPLNAGAETLVDWLELTAFFDDRHRARLDRIDNAFKIQDETEIEDVAEADTAREDRRALIEQEIDERASRLKDAYPFILSDDGEELSIKEKGERAGASFYLVCLVFSHATRSPILSRPPSARLLARGRRREYQILATLAVAGHLAGPALSFGWPRRSGATILEAIERACTLSQTGVPRPTPGPVASKYAKDGGMDVIGWRTAVDGMGPPQAICFGQAASGHRWAEKSAVDEQESFYESYYLHRPSTQSVGVTVVPFRLQIADHLMYGKRHGHILDRLRTPKAAVDGLRLWKAGTTVDEAESACLLALWLGRYRSQVLH